MIELFDDELNIFFFFTKEGVLKNYTQSMLQYLSKIGFIR